MNAEKGPQIAHAVGKLSPWRPLWEEGGTWLEMAERVPELKLLKGWEGM